MRVPNYIIKVITDYILIYDTDDGAKEYAVTGRVSQGSVLGPLLWNVMYDGILGLDILEEAKLIVFGDDIAIVVVAKLLEEVVQISNDTMRGLKLAEQKTEAVLISGRRKKETITFMVGGHEITSKSAIKYLGVMIDSKLSFKEHLEYASKKASLVNNALARIMPNIGGPRHSRRLLLAIEVPSVILHGSLVWVRAMNTISNRRQIGTINRLCALRVSSAFRTTSGDAVFVFAGIRPIDILAKELQRKYEKNR